MNQFKKLLLNIGVNCRHSIDEGVPRAIALEAALRASIDMQVAPLTESALAFLRIAPAFALAWAESAFSTIEVSHKLAASLMATSAPDEVVDSIELPWRCFCVDIPSGLLGECSPEFILLLNSRDGYFRALHAGRKTWGTGAEPSFSGWMFSKGTKVNIPRDSDFWIDGDEVTRVQSMMGRLLVGTCIEMQAEPTHKALSKTATSLMRFKRGEPRPYTYRLGRPVKSDVRAAVREYVSTGARCPLVQTLVRGHYKHQPHGPDRALRKYIHIEPYWRGDEDAPIVVRAHKL